MFIFFLIDFLIQFLSSWTHVTKHFGCAILKPLLRAKSYNFKAYEGRFFSNTVCNRAFQMLDFILIIDCVITLSKWLHNNKNRNWLNTGQMPGSSFAWCSACKSYASGPGCSKGGQHYQLDKSLFGHLQRHLVCTVMTKKANGYLQKRTLLGFITWINNMLSMLHLKGDQLQNIEMNNILINIRNCFYLWF